MCPIFRMVILYLPTTPTKCHNLFSLVKCSNSLYYLSWFNYCSNSMSNEDLNRPSVYTTPSQVQNYREKNKPSQESPFPEIPASNSPQTLQNVGRLWVEEYQWCSPESLSVNSDWKGNFKSSKSYNYNHITFHNYHYNNYQNEHYFEIIDIIVIIIIIIIITTFIHNNNHHYPNNHSLF